MGQRVNFDTQYCRSYKARLGAMGRLISANPAVAEYGLEIKELKDDLRKECVVVATLFLVSGTKPSILKDGEGAPKPTGIGAYVSEDAKYFVEDWSGRLEVKFTDGFNKLPVLVTGTVLGFVGNLQGVDVFLCSDVIFPVPITPTGPCAGLFKRPPAPQPKSILIFANPLINSGGIERMRVIADYCRDSVSDIIIIGDIFTTGTELPMTCLLDTWIKGSGVNINLIPGLNDPTGRMLPQEAIHPMLFAKRPDSAADTAPAIITLTNPARIQIAGRELVILSHHIVDDIAKYAKPVPGDVKVESKPLGIAHIPESLILDILEQMLTVRHLAPSAPDTLSCIPYSDEDPFILNACDFLITGGCSSLCYRNSKGAVLIGAPDFSASSVALLLDPATGSFEEMECPAFE